MDIFTASLNKFGEESQLRLVQEECGELIVAINHCLRKREGSIGKLAEETADVFIYLALLCAFLMQNDAIEYFRLMLSCKIRRMIERLEQADPDFFGGSRDGNQRL